MDVQLKKLQGVTTALITDALRRCGIISGWTKGVYPLPLMRNSNFTGRAVTLNYGPKKHKTIHKMPGQFEIARGLVAGDVMVFAAGGTGCWLTGDNIATVAKLQDAAAIVCDGCIRDIEDISKLEFPVFARGGGVKPYSTELALLEVGGTVNFADVEIRQGDVIVGDLDGIVVIPKEHVEDVIYQVEDIPALETEVQQLIFEKAPIEKLNAFMKTKMSKRP